MNMYPLLLRFLSLLLLIHAVNYTQAQRLLKWKTVYFDVSSIEESNVYLGLDEERNAFEEDIESLLDSKRYRKVVDTLLARNNHDIGMMNQHHLSNIGLAYYFLEKYDSAAYYLEKSEIESRHIINNAHKQLLGSSYFKIGLKNEGCEQLKSADQLYIDENSFMLACLLPSISYVDFPADSCSLTTDILLNPGDFFGLYAYPPLSSYGQINTNPYPMLDGGRDEHYRVSPADSGLLVLKKSDASCRSKKSKQRVRIETYSLDNPLRDWSGLNKTYNPDSLWRIIDKVEIEAREKYDPDTLIAKWSINGNGKFSINPPLTIEKKDRIVITTHGKIYLDSIGIDIDPDGFGTYRTHGSLTPAQRNNLHTFTRNKAFALGAVVVATASQPNGFSGISHSGETAFNARFSGRLSMFLNMKNTTNNTGLFYGDIVLKRNKSFSSWERKIQERLRTTRRSIQLPTENADKLVYEKVVRFTPIRLKISGEISTELVNNIPPSGVKGKIYDQDKRVSHINYGAIMYRIGDDLIWKGIKNKDHLYQLTANSAGILTIAINVRDETIVKGNFIVSLRKANQAY